MGIFDKLARKRHENTAGTKSVAADINTTKKAEPPSPPLDSEARIAYQQGFDCYRKGEYEESACFYRISADLGFFRAQYALALSYREGWGVKKDLAEAEMWAQKSAEQGYEAAAELLEEIREKRASSSKAYALGLNFYEQEDYEQAAQHYRTAANLDHAGAQIHLSICYATGRGVERNLDTAEMWAKRALTLGDDMAAELLEKIHEDQRDDAFELGVSCYDDGNYEQAVQHFRTAANLDHTDAQTWLALCYSTGEGVALDLDTAEMWAKRAAEQGSKKATEVLATIQRIQHDHALDLGNSFYEQGDYAQAVRYFRVAAQQGDATAQFNLAICYKDGDGVAQDQPEAVHWYRLAAEQGHVKAQCSLAICYTEGDGVEQDLDVAEMWAKRAAEQGGERAEELLEAIQSLRSNLVLDSGIACYKQGDYAQAVSLFRVVAELGYAEAQFNLALCYANGNGVEQDQQQAVHWYRLAAEQGHVTAQYNLAIRYSNGNGVEQDQQEANRWYRLAAQQGEASAQFNLAVRYENGNGVAVDLDAAEVWAQKAAQQGHEKAAQLLETIRQHKTSH